MFISLTKHLARIAVIAALYVVLSLLVFPLASGAIQIRVGESLSLLPLIYPFSCISLFIGCAITSIITGCMVLDVLLGSLTTLLASVLTMLMGRIIKNTFIKLFTGGLFPVLLNAFFLPLIWLFYGPLEYVYLLQVIFILIGQAISVYLIGVPLYFATTKINQKLPLL